VQVNPFWGFAEKGSDAMSDVVSSQCSDSPDRSDLALNFSVKRLEIRSRRELTGCFLKSAFDSLKNRSGNAILMRMSFSARQPMAKGCMPNCIR
jgi:hypothetical protein